MPNETLLPCPFCGEKARLTVSGFSCRCTNRNCGAVVGMFPTTEQAIEAWNTRAPGWQDISTAPKDGTEFQAWCAVDEHGVGGDALWWQIVNGHIECDVAWWEPRCKFDEHGNFAIWGRIDYDCDGWDSNLTHISPTHWQPRPTPPERD